MSLICSLINRRISAGICLILILLSWFVFGSTCYNDFVNYDDGLYVYDSSIIQKGISLDGVVRAFTKNHAGGWYPITTLSHMMDCQFYGLNPLGHHATNVGFHTATSILLFLVLRSMTGALWRSALVAALFSIHPLRMETVAWISERKDVLCGFFFVLTLGAYVRYIRVASDGGRVAIRRYFLVVFLFSLGLLSKSMIVTLPFLLILLDFWPLRRFGEGAHFHSSSKAFVPRYFVLLEKAPLLMLSVASCMATMLIEYKIAGAESIPLRWRIGNAFVSYVTYINQALFPVGLTVFYPHPLAELPLWKILASFFVLIGITWMVLSNVRKKPYLFTGWFWYIGMLVPVIGILQVGSQAHADRYTYLPLIGLFIAVCWLLGEWATTRRRCIVLSILSGIMLFGLVSISRTQATYWEDGISLWSHAIDVSDSSPLAYSCLGLALVDSGYIDLAIECYEESLRCNPDYPAAHSNLGVALKKAGRVEAAVVHLKRAIDLRPDWVEPLNNLAGAYEMLGEFSEADRWYRRALEVDPRCAVLHKNRAVFLKRRGFFAAAESEFRMALDIDPYMLDAEKGLVKLLAHKGQFAEAIQYQKGVLSRYPGRAVLHYNMGILFEAQGLTDDATRQYQMAIELDPDHRASLARLHALSQL